MNSTVERPARIRRRRLGSTIAVAALVLSSLALGATAANAYATTGCHLDPQAYDVDSAFYAPEIDASVAAWNSATDANMYASASAGLKVFAQNDGNTGYDGKATWQCTAFGVNRTSQAWFNLYYSYPQNQRRSVWTHELGHVMGLHHSGVANSIMNSVSTYTYTNFGTYTPRPDDIAGMNSVY
jgi:hypothetical protein